MERFTNFTDAIRRAAEVLVLDGNIIETKKWQGINPPAPMLEAINHSFTCNIPDNIPELTMQVKPNLPWAEAHFRERVGGKPLNPGNEYKNWPFYPRNVAKHQTRLLPEVDERDWSYLAAFIDGEGTVDPIRNRIHVYQKDVDMLRQLQEVYGGVGTVYDRNHPHTETPDGGEYPDQTLGVWRISAKKELAWVIEHIRPYLRVKHERADKIIEFLENRDEHGGEKPFGQLGDSRFTHTYMQRFWPKQAGGARTPHRGIYYDYGDLNDLVAHLKADPLSRQAYLTIWFPEDTGVVHGGRVPCTLGYHFINRGGKLHIVYYIRSCDYIRHFRDDIYMAARLVFWMLKELGWADVVPGTLTMHITSLHCWAQEKTIIMREYNTGDTIPREASSGL